MADVVMVVHRERNSYGASFPDFPGATTVARDMGTLHRKAIGMLAFHIAGLLEGGGQAPRPRSFEELQGDPAFSADSAGALILLVDFPNLDSSRSTSGADGTTETGALSGTFVPGL